MFVSFLVLPMKLVPDRMLDWFYQGMGISTENAVEISVDVV